MKLRMDTTAGSLVCGALAGALVSYASAQFHRIPEVASFARDVDSPKEFGQLYTDETVYTAEVIDRMLAEKETRLAALEDFVYSITNEVTDVD